MAEASKNSNKPITTASFVEQLTKKSEETKAIPPSNNSPLVLPDSCNMDGLSDSDLQTLLQNFKDLSSDEQHGLISYLKKLESNEPERVERLRKFVNLGNDSKKKESGRTSPFSSRLATSRQEKISKELEENILHEEIVPENMNIDSEDDDYTFEDVFNAATKNVNEKEEERKQREETKKKDDLKDTQAIIANLMGYIGKNSSATADNNPSTLDLNFAQTLNNLPVNMENIANIVGSIHNLQAQSLMRDEKSNSSSILNITNQKTDLTENQIPSNTLINPTINPTDFSNQNQFSRYDCPPNPPIYNQNIFPDQSNIQYPPINSYRNTYPETISYPQQNPYPNITPSDHREYFDNSYHRGGAGYSRGGFSRPTGNFDRNW